MIAAPSKAIQRILVGLAVSLLLHAAFIWLPHIELPLHETQLQPLIAKLQPLPRPAKTRAHKKPPIRKKPEPEKAFPEITPPAPATEVPVAKLDLPESSVVAVSSPAESTVMASAVTATSSVAEATAEVAAGPPHPPLPKHALLRFEVRLGNDGLTVGETRHSLEIDDNHYTLQSMTRTIGLATLVKTYVLQQTSQGKTDGQLLSPRTFKEEKTDESGTKNNSVVFDPDAKKLIFSSGKEVPLANNTQDILSILYQFPPQLEEGKVLTISITNGRNWEQYHFAITIDEMLITPLGKLHTVHFVKQHPPGKEGLEIWFAQEYRLLPVKLRHIESSGKIGGEAVITEIRVADN